MRLKERSAEMCEKSIFICSVYPSEMQTPPFKSIITHHSRFTIHDLTGGGHAEV